MEPLRIYRIDDKYIRFLKSRDSRVQDNKGRRRPYVGVVLYVGDFNSEPDRKYAELLRRQVTYINKNKANVLGHASSTYYNVVNKKNAFLLRVCCDFKKLEYACVHYDPNR